MEPCIYQQMYLLQDSHWWFVYQRFLFRSLIKSFFVVGKELRILDTGCGTGAMFGLLREYGWTVGIDHSKIALNFCFKSPHDVLCQADIARLPFKNNTFDIISIFDVLYHREVKDDAEAIRQVYSKLKDDGLAVFHEPAFDFLRRKHDIAEHTVRRYAIKDFKVKIETAGFKVKDIFYANNFLLLIVLMVKLKEKIFETKNRISSDLTELPYSVNKVLVYFSKIENWLLMKRIRVPFGVSLVCVAAKR